MKCKHGQKNQRKRPRKTVHFSARVTTLVGQARERSGRTWSEWVSFLYENYRRANDGAPVLDPGTHRLLVWSARALDQIASQVTGSVVDHNDHGAQHVRRVADALIVMDEIARVRAALESWAPRPVTANGGGGYHGRQ